MNLPNLLTVLRMFMVPLVVVFFLADQAFWALGIFLLAGLTDVLDGYLARKNGQITAFGQVMDPLADKLMLMTTLICLCITGRVPLIVPVIIALKECTMIAVAALLYRKHVVLPANRPGKLATLLFTLAVLLSFFSDYVAPLHTLALYAATAMAIFAMGYYGLCLVRMKLNLFDK